MGHARIDRRDGSFRDHQLRLAKLMGALVLGAGNAAIGRVGPTRCRVTAPGLEGLYRASCSGRPRSRGMPLVDREADAGNSAEPVGALTAGVLLARGDPCRVPGLSRVRAAVRRVIVIFAMEEPRGWPSRPVAARTLRRRRFA
jgi:hypothetical protein